MYSTHKSASSIFLHVHVKIYMYVDVCLSIVYASSVVFLVIQ